MSPARSMTVPAMTPAARMTWSRAAFRAMVKLARSGSVPGTVRGGVGDGGAQRLVGDQQGVDLLVDAGGGAGAQDPAAEDGGLELEVGGLDLPALVVEDGQVAGGVAGGVGQGGDQPVAAGGAPGAGGDGDLGVDDPDGDAAEARQPGAVRAAAAGRGASGRCSRCGRGSGSLPWLPRSARPGSRRRSSGRPAGSSRVQAAEQARGAGGLARGDGAEHGVDDGAGAAADQGQQPQHRVAGAAVGAAALLGVDGQVRLAVRRRS